MGSRGCGGGFVCVCVCDCLKRMFEERRGVREMLGVSVFWVGHTLILPLGSDLGDPVCREPVKTPSWGWDSGLRKLGQQRGGNPAVGNPQLTPSEVARGI